MLFHSTNMILSNNQKSYLLALKQKKFRQKYQKFIIEGDKMVNELIAETPELIQYVVYKDVINIDNLKKTAIQFQNDRINFERNIKTQYA